MRGITIVAANLGQGQLARLSTCSWQYRHGNSTSRLDCKVTTCQGAIEPGEILMLRFVVVPIACAFLLALTGGLAMAAPVKPSFDCRKARTDVEKQICGVPEYAALDRDIAILFAKAIKALPPAEVNRLKTGQAKWLKERDDCIGLIHGLNPVVFADVDHCISEQLIKRDAALKAIVAAGKVPEGAEQQ
jgi:uncharacterized protein YecT (DUF1311 family)